MKRILTLTLSLFLVISMQAQSPGKPYNWTYSAKKVSDNTFELHFLVDLNNPWHTYSQFTPDGGPLATKFTFSKNPLYSLEGPVAEEGKMLVRYEAVFGVDVKYFNGRVDFIQKIKVKGTAKTNFIGAVEFMVCNDEQCLPPTTERFTVALN